MSGPESENTGSGAGQLINALKTWRYLRLAMAGLAVTLFAAILEDLARGEHRSAGHTEHCLQGSISAYYYTPVHAFLVGALVAIGVCLYCIKGDTPVEDVLLNLAGMFAPIVALVPTDPPHQCRTFGFAINRFANAGNNMFALATLETIAFVFLFVLIKIKGKLPGDAPAPTVADLIGFGVGVVLLAVQWVFWVLSLNTDWVYKKPTHYTAAILMFVCIFLVVCFRAAAQDPGHGVWWHLTHPNLETVIAVLMLASLVLFAGLKFGVGWGKSVFQVEFCLIALFVFFWIVQTIRNWHGERAPQPIGPELVRRLAEPSPLGQPG